MDRPTLSVVAGLRAALQMLAGTARIIQKTSKPNGTNCSKKKTHCRKERQRRNCR